MNNDCTWNYEQYPEAFMKAYRMGFNDGKDFGMSIEREKHYTDISDSLVEKWLSLIKEGSWLGMPSGRNPESDVVHEEVEND